MTGAMPQFICDDDDPPQPGLRLLRLSDLLSEPLPPPTWLWEGRLRVGGVGLLAGKPKAGKSSFARALSVAVASGTPFCGGATRPGPVIYCALEEHRDDVNRAFRDLVGDSDPPDVRLYFGPIVADLLDRVSVESARLRPALIVFDTLARAVRLTDANDYAKTMNGLNPVLDLARDRNTSVLLVHHSRKGDPEDAQDGVLGSVGFTASVDATFIIRKEKDGRRAVQSIQRTGQDLPPTVLRFDEGTGAFDLGPTVSGARSANRQAEILDAILDDGPEGLTEADICRVVAGDRADIRRDLQALQEAGTIRRAGEGRRGSAYRYLVSRFPP